MDTYLVLQIITVASAVLMVAAILLQQRGASLGAGFGGSGELYTSRRGLDQSLYRATVVLAVIFVSSIVGNMILPGISS